MKDFLPWGDHKDALLGKAVFYESEDRRQPTMVGFVIEDGRREYGDAIRIFVPMTGRVELAGFDPVGDMGGTWRFIAAPGATIREEAPK